jgi:hypothetical protein
MFFTSSVCASAVLQHRRKAFQRRSEDGVGIGGAIGQLIKLREADRRAQFQTSCLLLLGKRDGGEECSLDWLSVRRSRLSKISPADALQDSVAPMFIRLLR